MYDIYLKHLSPWSTTDKRTDGLTN